MGGRRAAAAVPPSPALISLSSFSSTQPVRQLARAAGVGVLSGGVCERARREISFARARWVG